MKLLELKVPIFDINLTLIQVKTKTCFAKIKKYFDAINVSKEDIKEIEEKIKYGDYDGASTFSNKEAKGIVVIFYLFSSDKEKLSTYCHEKRHVEDDILIMRNIDDAETAGCLAGYLGTIFFDFMND